ncbi:MAG: Uma2 family endonuclease [Geitlerinemataceae cyanobacterium]
MSPLKNPVQPPETQPKENRAISWEEAIFPSSEIYSDEPQLETSLHLKQILLFLKCLEWIWRDRSDYYAAGNLSIYYSPHQRKTEDFNGPDFFVVLETDPKMRRSWVVWEEGGKYPNLIVEVLSDKTAKVDRTKKKKLYQDIFRTPDYFWFDPQTLEWAGFHLVDGKYQPLELNDRGLLWSQQLELYLGIHENFVRFFTAEGELIPTPEEDALSAQQELEVQRQQLEIERQRKEQLAAKLRELGIDPDTV